MEHAERGLHHAPDRELARRTRGCKTLLDLLYLGSALDLGQEDGVGRAARDHGEVVRAPGRLERVHAHDELAPAIAAGREGCGDLSARRGLGVGGDRVLEVEDERVRRQRARLLERARVRARHVQHAAAGPSTLAHAASLSTRAVIVRRCLGACRDPNKD